MTIYLYFINIDKPIEDTQIRLWRAVFHTLCIDFRKKAEGCGGLSEDGCWVSSRTSASPCLLGTYFLLFQSCIAQEGHRSPAVIQLSSRPHLTRVCRSDLLCQLLMTSKRELSLVKDKAVDSLFVLRSRRARGVWVSGFLGACVRGNKFITNKKRVFQQGSGFICLSSWYSGTNQVLLCMYSIISDVTYSAVLTSRVICQP